MTASRQNKKKIRILLEVDGVQAPVMFHRHVAGRATLVDDPQRTHHMNNIDDAVRAALHAVVGFELEE